MFFSIVLSRPVKYVYSHVSSNFDSTGGCFVIKLRPGNYKETSVKYVKGTLNISVFGIFYEEWKLKVVFNVKVTLVWLSVGSFVRSYSIGLNGVVR